jgi:hypothetical protein
MRKLSDIIDEYIIQEGYDTRHNFDKYLSLGMRALKELNYDVSGKPSFQLLELSPNHSACVPCGVVKVLQLFMYAQGGPIPIVESDRINPAIVQDGDIIEPDEIRRTRIIPDLFIGGITTDAIAARFRRGEFIGHNFAGAPYPYTYMRNHDTNRFEFSSNVTSPVVLKALFNPTAIDGNFYVEPFDEKVILAYLRYTDLRANRSVNMNEKLLAKREYEGARVQARKQHYAKDPRELAMAFRNDYGLNPT